MLRDLDACTCRDKRRSGRDVDRVPSVATCSHEIDGVVASEINAAHRVAHGPRRAHETRSRHGTLAAVGEQREKLAFRVVAAEYAMEFVVGDSFGGRHVPRLEAEEVPELADSLGRAYRLGMVLHRLYRHRLVAKRHYLAVGSLGGNLEAVGERRALDCERVVAHRLEALRERLEDALPVVAYAARLAVHKRLRADDAPTERLRYRLVSEADAEHRDFPRERLYRRERDSGGVGIARAGGYDE